MLVVPTNALLSHQKQSTAAIPNLLKKASPCNDRKANGNGSKVDLKLVQHFNMDQCRSLAKMLANSGNSQLLVKSGDAVSASGHSTSIHSQSALRKCPQTLSEYENEPPDEGRIKTDSSKDARTSFQDEQDLVRANATITSVKDTATSMQYFDKLLESVDKAISSQYGTTNNSQSLTFGEISASLERVERKYFYRAVMAKNCKAGSIKRKGSSICKFCIADSKRGKPNNFSASSTNTSGRDFVTESSSVDSSSIHVTDDASNSSFSLVSNPSSSVLLGSSKVNKASQQMLLSRSEERMLLRDLEHDARKVSLNLFSYLRRAGEGISECLLKYNTLPHT